MAADPVVTVEQIPEGLTELLRSAEMGQFLNEVGHAITSSAITYTGEFTGELRASMEWRVEDVDQGTQLLLGSGTDSTLTVGQAALNWYGHKDPDGIAVQPDYPQWHTHPGVKPQPTHPYENALTELHVPYKYAPEYEEWATTPGTRGDK